MDMATGRVARSDDDVALIGTRVAGEGSVSGTARVIRSVEEIELFQEDEILVARMTDPQWYPLFPKARGIVTEVGGWLSHAAIVAREYNLPATVGVANVCNSIETGDIIELCDDGSINLISDRRSPESPLRAKVNQPTLPAEEQNSVATNNKLRSQVTDLQQILNRALKGSQGKAANAKSVDRADEKKVLDSVRKAEPTPPLKKAQ